MCETAIKLYSSFDLLLNFVQSINPEASLQAILEYSSHFQIIFHAVALITQ